MIRSFVEDLIRPLSGSLGKKLRFWYYKKRLGACGKNVFIDTGVFFLNSKDIMLGDNCWIDKNCVLIAGALQKTNVSLKLSPTYDQSPTPGKLIIGNNAHIGIGTVIQAHGGVSVGNYFTTSAQCRIFSLSNDPYKCRKGTVGEANDIHYVMTPVVIEDNVWLGLNVSVIGSHIQSDVFVQPNSIVTGALPANSVAAGSPAKKNRSRFNS